MDAVLEVTYRMDHLMELLTRPRLLQDEVEEHRVVDVHFARAHGVSKATSVVACPLRPKPHEMDDPFVKAHWV